MAIEDYLYKGLSYYQTIPECIAKPIGFCYSLIPKSVRYGSLYTVYKNLLEESEKWDETTIKNFTLVQLKKAIENAYMNSSFYRDLFTSSGFKPDDLKDINDILKVPFTNKNLLRNSKDHVLNSSYSPDRLLYVTTGGTSGIPIELYYVKGRERTREYVFMTDQWKRVGYKDGDKIARIRGTVVDQKWENQYFRYEPIKNRLYLSTYDLHEDTIPIYIEKLLKFKPHFIHTYPSAITILAQYLKSNNVTIPGLKAILSSSEQFYPGQRELISEAFNCRVFSWYGHTESTTLAGECECSQFYHLYFQYGYTELIDENDDSIHEPGVRGEITGTSYELSAFPIIRYRTGDTAEWVNGKCSCGRNYKLMTNVIGRWFQEQIITKKNSSISLTALNMHSDIFDNVLQYQFYQKVKGKVILRVVKKGKYSLLDENKIIRSFNSKFKDLVDFEINYVDLIPRTTRGKHRFLISEVNK